MNKWVDAFFQGGWMFFAVAIWWCICPWLVRLVHTKLFGDAPEAKQIDAPPAQK